MTDFGDWIRRQWNGASFGTSGRLSALANLAAQLHEVAKGYEQWEGDMLLDGRVWREECGLPHLTQHLYDKLMLLQGRRNAALDACKEFQEKYGND